MSLEIQTYFRDHVSSQGNVSVVGVEANVVGEVRKLVFTERQVIRVVYWDVNSLVSLVSFGVDMLSLVDDPGIEVVLGEDLVQRRWNNSDGVFALEDRGDVSLDELSFVYVHTGPCSGLQEHRVVLRRQEHSREKSDFLAQLTDRVRVDGTFRLYMTSLEHAVVVQNGLRLVIELNIRFDVIVEAKVVQFLVRQILGYVFQ